MFFVILEYEADQLASGIAVKTIGSPVERVKDSKAERRRHRRHEIQLQGVLRTCGGPVACSVHNFSAGGASVEVDADLRIGDPVRVELADFGPIAGHVVRISSTTAAIVFEVTEAAKDASLAQ